MSTVFKTAAAMGDWENVDNTTDPRQEYVSSLSEVGLNLYAKQRSGTTHKVFRKSATAWTAEEHGGRSRP